jgi:hypothetical protein
VKKNSPPCDFIKELDTTQKLLSSSLLSPHV